MSLSILPQDLLFEVMRFLRAEQQIGISRVSKEFYQTVVSRFPALELNLIGGNIKEKLSSFLDCPFVEQVTVLNLSENNLSEENIITLANSNRFKNLQELILSKNVFSMACAEAFTKSSFLRQLKYIDLRNTFFVWKDHELVDVRKFISSQPQDLQEFWYLVLGNAGPEIVPEWLLRGFKGTSKLHCETQLELGEYFFRTDNNIDLAILCLEELVNNPLAHNRDVGMYVLAGIYVQLGKEFHSKAFQLFLQAANLGDKLSFLSVANMYLTGLGVEHNYEESLKWYKKFIESGGEDNDGFVAHQIGVLYFDYVKDIPQALKWWNESFVKNNPTAKYSLGTIYLNGEGVERDVKKGIALLEESAKDGNADAQNALGAIYLEGEDSIEVDLDKAKEFLLSAANGEDSDAVYNLGILAQTQGKYEEALERFQEALDKGNNSAGYAIGIYYFKGEFVPLDEEKAIYFTQLSANDNCLEAQEYLGEIYSCKDSSVYNLSKAVKWYETAVENGSIEAMYKCGYTYEAAENVEMAIYWYEKGAQNGNSSAMNNLASIYYEKKDYPKARQWIDKALDQNNSYAYCTMGEWYLEGECVEKDYSKALFYFTKSSEFTAEEDDKEEVCPTAFLNLYKLYSQGLGCEKDLEKAQELLEKAATFGDEEAIEILEAQESTQESKKRKSNTQDDDNASKKRK